MKKKVTIQGVKGCFHDAAARAYFAGEDIDVVPCETFGSMFDCLKSDSSLIGAMAIENTIAGSLLQNHELLRQSNLTVVGEYKMRISHVLCALPGQNIDELTEVNSHPMALMQCEQFLHRHPNLKMVEKTDTAGSAEEIAKLGLRGHAAICGKLDPIMSHELSYGKKIDKASLVFTLPHTQGSLAKILTIFSFYDINLSKIQSIPIIGREWEYRFFINLTFDDYTRYRQSIEAVKPLITDFKILGEYSNFNQDGKE